MKALFSTEKELSELVLSYLENHGFLAITEAPNMGQSADIAAWRGTRLFVFEMKLNDWKRVLRQASTHLFVANHVFVVVPAKKYSKEFSTTAEKLGIGVIYVDPMDGNWDIIVPAPGSKMIWKPQREQFCKHMGAILHGS